MDLQHRYEDEQRRGVAPQDQTVFYCDCGDLNTHGIDCGRCWPFSRPIQSPKPIVDVGG